MELFTQELCILLILQKRKENMFPKSLEKAIKKYEKMNKKFKKFDLKVTKIDINAPNPQVHGFKDIESAYEASETLERFYGSMSIVGTPDDGSTPIEFLDHLPEDPTEKDILNTISMSEEISELMGT